MNGNQERLAKKRPFDGTASDDTGVGTPVL
jgi:hypothetical protein